MRATQYISALPALLLFLGALAQEPSSRTQMNETNAPVKRVLEGANFGSAGKVGWSLEIELRSAKVPSGTSLLRLNGKDRQTWLEGLTTGPAGAERLDFQLHTDYRIEPLTVGIPMGVLSRSSPGKILLRYEAFRLDLFYCGVLVDEEWPIGNVKIGQEPELEFSAPIKQVSIWNTALPDEVITSLNGGLKKVAASANTFLGPEPDHIQYSRPRGYNTNAGDAMPFYHDGTFHLFFLLDRRQHHSKWGLGAHQWAHISSTDLVHWTHYPVALAIEHDWEGSICTGSVFFHNGQYFAYYATRMPDRSERLGVAVSEDGIHFTKTIPTPFAEPSVPFIHGPNRDPFVFENSGQFHMLVTAAITAGTDGKNEGVLEHLVSKDLSNWSVVKEPFLLAGSPAQPECSDLFKWGNWYYLVFSLGGTTHYRMSKSALGPWITPESDILDGPEAFVMKASEFKGDRRLLVGFLQHDNQYGGDLVFRELLQEKGGMLGTTIPKEMQLPTKRTKTSTAISLSNGDESGRSIEIGDNARVTAKVFSKAQSTFTIHIGSAEGEALVFDPGASTVTWTDSLGKPARAKLDHVEDLVGQTSIVLTLDGTLADLSVNGHRTLIHRLASSNHQRIYFSSKGGELVVSDIIVSSL
jgi:hypothetical protein